MGKQLLSFRNRTEERVLTWLSLFYAPLPIAYGLLIHSRVRRLQPSANSEQLGAMAIYGRRSTGRDIGLGYDPATGMAAPHSAAPVLMPIRRYPSELPTATAARGHWY